MPEEVAPDLRSRITGSESSEVDDKNRISLSVRQRARLGNPFVLLIGRRKCIEAMPQDVWNEKCEEIDKYGVNSGSAEDYARLIYKDAIENIKWDSQGRFVLPATLRKEAQINREIQLVGMGRYLEIWSKEEFDKFEANREGYMTDRLEQYRSIYERMIGKIS